MEEGVVHVHGWALQQQENEVQASQIGSAIETLLHTNPQEQDHAHALLDLGLRLQFLDPET